MRSDTTPSARVPATPQIGDRVRSFSDEIHVLFAGSALDVFEFRSVAGGEPPLHVHEREDEWFYILDGTLTAYVDGSERQARAGELVHLPRGVAHTFALDTPTLRVLQVNAPGGFVAMFFAIAGVFADRDMPPAPGPEHMADLGPIFARHQITVAGPNPRYSG